MKCRLFRLCLPALVLVGLLVVGCPGSNNEDNQHELIGKWEIEKIIVDNTAVELPFFERYSGGYLFTADNVTEYRNGSPYSSTMGMYTQKKIIYSQTGESIYAYSINKNTLTLTALDGSWGEIAKKVDIFSWEGPNEDVDPQLKIVEGFTFDNYPRVDGSTSTYPLTVLIACKLLGTRYQWNRDSDGLWTISPILKSEYNVKRLWEKIKVSQTHQSFIKLIDNQTDFILSARTMSPDEKAYADAAGISLIETPIALDALVFIVHPTNPIESITIAQIQDIYTGKITNWNEVDGPYGRPINPYLRNPNSGSQELMESLVMKDLGTLEFPYSYEVIHSMSGAFETVQSDPDSICFTIYYYKEYMYKEQNTKSIAIEGIYPNKENIGSNAYPLTAEVYAVIRSDLDKSSTAYTLYELLQTETGKEVISESGYVPN